MWAGFNYSDMKHARQRKPTWTDLNNLHWWIHNICLFVRSFFNNWLDRGRLQWLLVWLYLQKFNHYKECGWKIKQYTKLINEKEKNKPWDTSGLNLNPGTDTNIIDQIQKQIVPLHHTPKPVVMHNLRLII